MPSVPPLETALAEKLRAEFAEIAAVAAQAARLGVTVDAADAMRKGISPDALRRSVLDALAARAEATERRRRGPSHRLPPATARSSSAPASVPPRGSRLITEEHQTCPS